jgi:hypothetical protein
VSSLTYDFFTLAQIAIKKARVNIPQEVMRVLESAEKPRVKARRLGAVSEKNGSLKLSILCDTEAAAAALCQKP